MKILDKEQILRKIQRLTVEILERNYGEKDIILVGINQNGFEMASLLAKEFKGRTTTKVKLTQLNLSQIKLVE